MSSATILRRASLAGVAFLAFATAWTAHAEEPSSAAAKGGPVPFEEEFKRADVDKDGKVSVEEATAAGLFTDGSFKDFDEDKDGTVTLFELGDALQQRVRRWLSDFESADTDKDGYVSEAEAKAAGPSMLALFKRADRDEHGRLSREEFDLYARTSYYSETSGRGVVPNIFNKKF